MEANGRGRNSFFTLCLLPLLLLAGLDSSKVGMAGSMADQNGHTDRPNKGRGIAWLIGLMQREWAANTSTHRLITTRYCFVGMDMSSKLMSEECPKSGSIGLRPYENDNSVAKNV